MIPGCQRCGERNVALKEGLCHRCWRVESAATITMDVGLVECPFCGVVSGPFGPMEASRWVIYFHCLQCGHDWQWTVAEIHEQERLQGWSFDELRSLLLELRAELAA